jgi:hypothetical protein
MKKISAVDDALKKQWFRAEGVAKEEKDDSSERAEDLPPDLEYAQDLWDGCFRAAVTGCSQWIHHGCPGCLIRP